MNGRFSPWGELPVGDDQAVTCASGLRLAPAPAGRGERRIRRALDLLKLLARLRGEDWRTTFVRLVEAEARRVIGS